MTQHHKLIGLFLSLVLSIAVLIGCNSEKEQDQMSLKESLVLFSQVLSEDDLDGLTLTVYNKGSVLTPIPEDIEGLIDRVKKDHPDEIITIDTDVLKKNRDSLKQLAEESFTLSEEEVFMNITWCFIFETGNQERALEIAIGGSSKDEAANAEYGYIYVNGFTVKRNDTVWEILNALLQQADGQDRGRIA